jgi:hypothetical protein
MLLRLIQRVVSLAEGGREWRNWGFWRRGAGQHGLATLLKTQQTQQNQDDLFDVSTR